VIRVGEGIDVIMIWSTKRIYGNGGNGQGPGRSAGHSGKEMGEEKGLIAGGFARRRREESQLSCPGDGV
jgi:hypothetical protein